MKEYYTIVTIRKIVTLEKGSKMIKEHYTDGTETYTVYADHETALTEFKKLITK